MKKNCKYYGFKKSKQKKTPHSMYGRFNLVVYINYNSCLEWTAFDWAQKIYMSCVNE